MRDEKYVIHKYSNELSKSLDEVILLGRPISKNMSLKCFFG